MDIKNSYCVAEYIACLKRFDMLQTVLFWQKRHKAFSWRLILKPMKIFMNSPANAAHGRRSISFHIQHHFEYGNIERNCAPCYSGKVAGPFPVAAKHDANLHVKKAYKNIQ